MVGSRRPGAWLTSNSSERAGGSSSTFNKALDPSGYFSSSALSTMQTRQPPSTAGEGGWRVCIVDSADVLKYPEGSNALLKVLEEPPARSLLLLVSHAPGRLLPTIRSRCR